MEKFKEFIKDKVETQKSLGKGGEKTVYPYPDNSQRVIGVYSSKHEFLWEKSPEYNKAKFYLTKILHMLFPENIPDIHKRVVIHHQGMDYFLKFHLTSVLEYGSDVILYFDPPYEEEKLYLQFYTALTSLRQFKGEVWIEACEQKSSEKILQFPEFFLPVKRYNHSHHFIAIFHLQ